MIRWIHDISKIDILIRHEIITFFDHLPHHIKPTTMAHIIICEIWQRYSLGEVCPYFGYPVFVFDVFCEGEMVVFISATVVACPLLTILTFFSYVQDCLLGD
jgi:hypothetical protein